MSLDENFNNFNNVDYERVPERYEERYEERYPERYPERLSERYPERLPERHDERKTPTTTIILYVLIGVTALLVIAVAYLCLKKASTDDIEDLENKITDLETKLENVAENSGIDNTTLSRLIDRKVEEYINDLQLGGDGSPSINIEAGSTSNSKLMALQSQVTNMSSQVQTLQVKMDNAERNISSLSDKYDQEIEKSIKDAIKKAVEENTQLQDFQTQVDTRITNKWSNEYKEQVESIVNTKVDDAKSDLEEYVTKNFQKKAAEKYTPNYQFDDFY